VTDLIWPESAFPFLLSREPVALQRIADFLRDGAVLATGAARADAPTGGRPARYYNSILTLNRTGLLPARYDKRHLVPFGEYTPFESVLRRLGVTEIVHFAGGYQPGQGSNLLPMPGAPDALALICYEAIFPSEWGGAREGAAERAGWILNVTDDAWFGVTPGPYQHFAQARLRAIEWGLPLVRSANGGLSAIVDSYGRIISAADFGAEGVVDGELPGALPPTYESRWGSAVFGLALAALLAAATALKARA
jgi:apolipoprotein N-acyltransferase